MAREPNLKRLLYILLLMFTLLFCAIGTLVLFNFQQSIRRMDVLAINEVATDLQRGRIKRIIIAGDRLQLIYRDGSERLSYKSPDSSLSEQLVALGVDRVALSPDNVKIEEKPQSVCLVLATGLGYATPFIILVSPILIIAIWYIKRWRS
jgi:hypothetical protein